MDLNFPELKRLDELEEIVKEARQGFTPKKVIFTNGCFDIIHKGHRYILNEADKLGDILIVAVNSDKSAKKFKGDDRPKNNEMDRAYVIAGFKGVDYVAIFDEDTPLKLLERLKPDVNVKGGGYVPGRVEKEKEIMDKYGGILMTFPLIEGYSTTKIINKIKDGK